MKNKITYILDSKFTYILNRVTAIILLIICTTISLLAFNYPLEIEFREATSWLHVLALNAGVNIYDHSQTSFINMNHGPIDPILKSLISRTLPFLESWQVTRIFVLLLPLCIILSLFFCFKKNKHSQPLINAIILGLGFYLLSLTIQPFYLLIGRSDPTALFFLIPYLIFILHSSDSNKKTLLLLGALGGLAFLSNWRYIPSILAGAWIFIIQEFFNKKRFIPRVLTFTLGLMTPFLLVLIFVFHFDFQLYYKHFFGFFQKASGWGAVSAPDFQYIFNDFTQYLFKITFTTFSLTFLALGISYSELTSKKRAILFFAWIPMIFGIFIVSFYGYYLNAAGGGRYYLHPLYIWLFIFFIWIIKNTNKEKSTFLKLVVILLLPFLNWKMLYKNNIHFYNHHSTATEFMNYLREINKKSPILSEQLYFYKEKYSDEIIDMGDTVYVISQGTYMGEGFNKNSHKFFNSITQYKYIYGSVIYSPPLRKILEEKYKILRSSPPHFFSNGWYDSQLWIKKTNAK